MRKDSNKATKKYHEEDCSYPTTKMQLHWRLEELKARYDELVNDDFAYENPLILMEDDIRYSPPENLCSIRHLIKAIEFTEAELGEKTREENPILIFRLPESVFQYSLLA